MKLRDIKNQLKRIKDLAKDYEAAHSEEDFLWESVLEAIAKEKCEDGTEAEFAREALKSRKIEFNRYCA